MYLLIIRSVSGLPLTNLLRSCDLSFGSGALKCFIEFGKDLGLHFEAGKATLRTRGGVPERLEDSGWDES